MTSPIHAALESVRQRQRLRLMQQWAMYGLAVSGLLGLLLAVWKFQTQAPIGWPVVAALLGIGPLVAAALSAFRPSSWSAAATAVDTHYGLKDSVLSALDFVATKAPSDFQQLAISEAAARLAQVEARAVVPFVWPQRAQSALSIASLAVALLLWPLAPREAQATTETAPAVKAAVALIEDEIKQLAEIAEQQARPELNELMQELNQQLKVMQVKGLERREALATISEMQAKLAQRVKEFNPAVVDSQMKSLGEALSTADPFKPAAADLKNSDFEQAADKLEKLDRSTLDREESRAASEKLKQVAEKMKTDGLEELSKKVNELSEAAKANDPDKTRDASREMAAMVRENGIRRNLGEMLANKRSRIGDSKMMLETGDVPGDKNSLIKGKNKKSERESNNFGQGEHGKLDGAKTQLSTSRQFQQLQGQMGEGTSDRESTTSGEGQDAARREYQKAFGKYQKMSEAVLDSEPIPLGQRQLIRKYFELIRPEPESSSAVPADKAIGR